MKLILLLLIVAPAAMAEVGYGAGGINTRVSGNRTLRGYGAGGIGSSSKTITIRGYGAGGIQTQKRSTIVGNSKLVRVPSSVGRPKQAGILAAGNRTRQVGIGGVVSPKKTNPPSYGDGGYVRVKRR